MHLNKFFNAWSTISVSLVVHFSIYLTSSLWVYLHENTFCFPKDKYLYKNEWVLRNKGAGEVCASMNFERQETNIITYSQIKKMQAYVACYYLVVILTPSIPIYVI